jgi:hypothetical protein
MGIAVSLIISAVGLILALAVHPSHPGSVDPNTVGWILFVVGVVGLVLDLLLWSSLGPGYLRRTTTYAEGGPRYGGYAYPAPRPWGWGGRRVVQEDEVAGPAAGGPGPPAAPPPP